MHIEHGVCSRSEDDEKVNQDALDKLRDVADTKKEKYNKARCSNWAISSQVQFLRSLVFT